MSTETTDMPAWPLIRGRTAWLAGVNWVPVPAHLSKNIKRLARRKGADRFVTYCYQTPAGTEYVAGLASMADFGAPGQRVNVIGALALRVTPALGRAGYAIISLAPGVYTFVGVVDGVLMNDIVGDAPAMIQARETFLRFNAEPDGGWRCYAPPEFGVAGSSLFDLDTVLTAKKPAASARFQAVSDKKPLMGVIALAAVLFGSYYGWQLYADNQQNLRMQAARQAFLQAQAAATQITSPWETEPSVRVFVAACVQGWQTLPLSLAGWLLSEAECKRIDGKKGVIRAAYAKPDGGTLGDFSLRVHQHFSGHYVPFFNAPGAGDRGGYTQPVVWATREDKRPLPSADTQVQRLTTFAQQTRLTFAFTEENSRLTDDAGAETLLPWRVFTLSLKTDIPPALLFSDLDDTGVRLHAIKLSLQQGRLTYQTEGKFYARP